MAVIQNSWIEKQKKKKSNDRDNSHEPENFAEKKSYIKKPLKHFTNAARSILVKTLRGIRK